jgi:Ca2+-binding RTX toxin-like protein
MEGNGGDDLMYGGLERDDILGGSSDLFGLDTAEKRPDGSDRIFGGAATPDRLARNAFTGPADPLIADDRLHALDNDFILGDNGRIFRPVGTNGIDTGAFLEFDYDDPAFAGYSADPAYQIIPRTIDLLDYSPDPMVASIGDQDIVNGESGDDVIHGQTGDDILFGDAEDDDVYGEVANDWISGGTGEDGILGDDGFLYTSRNDNDPEPLYGIDGIPNNRLDDLIATPGGIQQSIINVADKLKKTVNLEPFDIGSDDILFGGLGDDFVHGGAGDDGISGAEALPTAAARVGDDVFVTGYDAPFNPGDILGSEFFRPDEFALYDENDPRSKILVNVGTEQNPDFVEFFLNFEAFTDINDQVATMIHDGDDRLFGDDGNDWIVGGTDQDHMFGGYGHDLLQLDDNLETNGAANDTFDVPEFVGLSVVNPAQPNADTAYGGAGRDVLIINSGADRSIDWVGEFNSYIVPFAPFGQFHASRSLQPQLRDYLYDLSESDGVDPTRANDTGEDANRNGEPEGELGLVLQQDDDWQDQTGPPDDPQAGNIPGGRRDVQESEDFENVAAMLFAVESGDWSVVDGRYQGDGTTVDGDAVSLFYVNDAVPSFFELEVLVNMTHGTGNEATNAYIVFDYQSATDFKFAGLNAQHNRVYLGHRDADGWTIDAQANLTLTWNRDYQVKVEINKMTAKLFVDDVERVAFTYPFDGAELYDLLNNGMVGLAARDATARFDDVRMLVLPKLVHDVLAEDFQAGTAGAFLPAAGSWQLLGDAPTDPIGGPIGRGPTTGGTSMSFGDAAVGGASGDIRYVGRPSLSGDTALAAFTLLVGANSQVFYDAVVNTSSFGGLASTSTARRTSSSRRSTRRTTWW